MTCEGCSKAVNNVLKKVKGINIYIKKLLKCNFFFKKKRSRKN